MADRTLSPRVLARSIIIALGLLALAFLLWSGRNILFVAFFGVLVGIFLSAFTGWLEGRGLDRLLALSLVLVAVAGLTAGFWILLWPTLSEQLSTVGRELPQTARTVGDWIETQFSAVSGEVGDPEGQIEEQVRTGLADQVGTMLGGALPIINTVAGALAGALVVLVVGVYTAARPALYRDGFVRLVPPAHRDRVTLTLDRSEHTLRRWMIGTLINMVLVALLVLGGLWLLDVPAAIALAVIAGLFEFIPIIGPILSAVPAIAVGLTVSPATALWVTLLYIVVQQIEGNVLTPLVMRGAARLPPALTVLFQALMAVIFGFLGLLLAVPVLVVVMVATNTLYVEPLETD